MITKLQIEKKEAEILCDQWDEKGTPVYMCFGRTRNGIVDILLWNELAEFAARTREDQ